MKCIAIDTTGAALTVALIDGDGSDFCSKEVGKSGHSSLLMPTVDALLAKNGVKADELDAIAAVVGPGSFTGIRIGAAAATALAFALNAKRIAVTSFELLAYNRRKVFAAVDAGHGNVYAAHMEDGRMTDALFLEKDEAAVTAGLCFEPSAPVAEALIAVVRQKAAAGEYVSAFEPYYMRKSQAEREKDEI